MGEVQRLLVRAPNWLGDAVLALPALAAVRRAFEGRTMIVAAIPSVAPMFEESTAAAPDEVIAIDRAREQEELRAAKADAILLLPNSFGSAWRASRSGASLKSPRQRAAAEAEASQRGRIRPSCVTDAISTPSLR